MTTDHRSVERDIIEHTLQHLIPRAVPANLTVEVTETTPYGGTSTWSGTPAGLADLITTALYGRPGSTPTTPSPLAQAEDAKRARDLHGEIGALTAGGQQLEAAPWYPSQPGDIVHIAYPASGLAQAYGETYLIEAAQHEQCLSMRLLHHSPGLSEELAATAGCYAATQDLDPLMDPWFEAGSDHITVIRDGAVVPNRSRRT